ncbi:hypothetical protein Tco_1466222 [Tanacetum coccineum]
MLFAAQLIPKFQGIRRCNNYVVRQSIPCYPECKIVRKILLDHPLRYAMIATADVPAVYLQQFWKTEDTIIFKLDNQEIFYTIDMFCNTLQLPVETLENPFVVPANIEIIKSFMNKFGYQGVVDKVNAFYMKFLAQPWQTMFKKFTSIPLRIEEDYHSIKDDVLLVSVYTTGNVTVQGMLILDAFLTEEIRATNDFKEYEKVFVNVVVPMNQPQPIVSTQGMHRSTPRAYKTPTLTIASSQIKKRKQRAGETSSPRKPLKATLLSLILHKTVLAVEAQENVSKVQENLVEEEIEKIVEGKEDEESYASEFADSMLNDDIDDSDTRIEPESYKENPEVVADEDVSKKKDDEKDEDKVNDDDVEKEDDAVVENDNDDHTDHTLVGNHATGSMETRNMQMQTPILTPTRSPRKVLSSNKTISEELTTNVSLTTATTSKDSSILKCEKRSISYKMKILPGSIVGMCKRCGQIRTQEMPRLVKLAVDKDREVTPINVLELISKEFTTLIKEMFRKHMHNTTLNLYPITSSSTAEKTTVDLQQQLYLNMKTKPQDQAANPELLEILKAKFEKP